MAKEKQRIFERQQAQARAELEAAMARRALEPVESANDRLVRRATEYDNARPGLQTKYRALTSGSAVDKDFEDFLHAGEFFFGGGGDGGGQGC